jgi:hypothetical protein
LLRAAEDQRRCQLKGHYYFSEDNETENDYYAIRRLPAALASSFASTIEGTPAQCEKRARTFAFIETPSTAAGIWMGLSVMLARVTKMLRNAKLVGRLTVDCPAYPKKSR